MYFNQGSRLLSKIGLFKEKVKSVESIKVMSRNFKILEPLGSANAILFSSPHSGSNYFDWFLNQTSLDMLSIRSSEDAFVGDIFESAPFFGSYLMESLIPRAILDLNRSRNDLDPKIIANYESKNINSRVASGLGVIPRVVGNGQNIYSKKLSLSAVQFRIDNYYNPYHQKLSSLLRFLKEKFGCAILVDCHSMPSEVLKYKKNKFQRLPDIILGDRFGMSCDARIVDFLQSVFEDEGFTVSRNIPFSGGYITQLYGRPVKNIHSVQIEISRALYMNEKLIEKNKNFKNFCESMKNVIFKITQMEKYLYDLEIAAE